MLIHREPPRKGSEQVIFKISLTGEARACMLAAVWGKILGLLARPGVHLVTAGWWEDLEYSKKRARAAGVARPPAGARGGSCLPSLRKYSGSWTLQRTSVDLLRSLPGPEVSSVQASVSWLATWREAWDRSLVCGFLFSVIGRIDHSDGL